MPEFFYHMRQAPLSDHLAPRSKGRWRSGATLLLLVCGLAGCSAETAPNMLNAQGPAAARINDLWWLMFWLATFVFVVVLLLTGLAIYRSRQRNTGASHHFAARPLFFLTAGGLIPLFILIFLIVASLRAGRAITLANEDALIVDVVGHQWWWEVRYPGQEIITANEIHIPAGEPVTFRITTQDVIHSFWIPQLHGKLDMLPGRVNQMQLEATAPGEYLGLCAEFCGIQHTFMLFKVIAHPPEIFAEWVDERQQTAVAPTDALQARGMAVFFAANCNQCHQIRGITEPGPAVGAVGPDLTHLGSRSTLAAGRVENNEETLALFITAPDSVKPGVHMPATPLPGEDLDALVAFLLSLE